MRRIMSIILLALTVILAGCALVVDSQGAKFGNPRDFAEATHIAQMSENAAAATMQAVSIEATQQAARLKIEATRAAIAADKQRAETGKVQAEATISSAKAQTEVEAQPSAAAGKSTMYLLGYAGAGAGALVLVIGLAFGITAWVNKRASTIYPNKQGQFPVVVRKGPGWIAIHDPNRSLGPGTVMHTPGLLERAGYALALARGKAPALQPGAEYPQPADVPAMLQVASQAQASQLQIAEKSGRPKFMLTVTPQPGPQEQKPVRGRMPPIAFVNDPDQIESFERKLLEAGDK